MAAAAAADEQNDSVVRDGDYAILDENGEKKSIVHISTNG